MGVGHLPPNISLSDKKVGQKRIIADSRGLKVTNTICVLRLPPKNLD